MVMGPRGVESSALRLLQSLRRRVMNDVDGVIGGD